MSSFENWKTALSISVFTREFIDEVKAAGIDTVEISPRRNDLGVIDWVQLKRDLEEAGVCARSFHLPFARNIYNIAHLDKDVRKMSIQDAKHYLEKAAFFGSRIAVVHPSSEPIETEDRAAALENSINGLRELADHAEGLGVRLAVENLPRTCLCRDAAEMRAILDSDRRLGFCFDVNHLLTDTHENMVRTCGDRLVTLHISDYDFMDERHCIPGDGTIDFGKLITMLESTGYDDAFTYEVNLGGSSKEEFSFPPYTPRDIAANKKNLRSVTGEGKKI